MLIFDISGPWVLYYSFYLPSVKTPKMAANPLKKTEIPLEMTEIQAFRAFFQRYGWTLWISLGIIYGPRREKIVLGVREQQKRRPACASA